MVFFSKRAISSLLAGCLILSLQSTTVEAECEADITQVRQIGVTDYVEKPITILTQSPSEITFELSQEWTATLDDLFVRFKDTDYGSPKCLAFSDRVSTWTSGSLTAVCTKMSKIALVEVWASDKDFIKDSDNATLPDCACDPPADLGPMVKYMFTVECVSKCEDASCAPGAAPYVAAPTESPPAAAVDAPPCESGYSLHEVCDGLAIHAHDEITFASAEPTRVVGNIGVYPGTSITGKYEIMPGGGARLSDTQAFSNKIWGSSGDFNTYFEERAPSDYFDLGDGPEIGGRTFYPGVYRAKSAINFAYGKVVTLDGNNEENPQWIFQCGTTLVTAADTYFILKNGAKASNVIWVLETAATLGARSILEGSILAYTSVTFGTNSEVRGCVIAKNSVTAESRGYVNVKSNGSAACPSGLGSCQNFAVHARDTITFAGTERNSVITGGDMGVAPGTAITGTYDMVNGVISNGDLNFANEVMFSHADLRSPKSYDKEVYWGVGIMEIGGMTIYPGTYRVGESIQFHGTTPVTLDAKDNPDAMWLFQAGSTFITAADTGFILKNGAQAKNIIWALGTAATLGARSVVEGSILAATAITMGTNAQINGCAIAMTAITFETEGFVTMP
jgi:hypothetical protein